MSDDLTFFTKEEYTTALREKITSTEESPFLEFREEDLAYLQQALEYVNKLDNVEAIEQYIQNQHIDL